MSTMIPIPRPDLIIIIEQLEQQLAYYKAYLEPKVELTEEETQAEKIKQRMVEAGMATYE